MGLLQLSCVLDMCDAQVQQVQMGSNVVEFNVRNITIKSKSQDKVMAVGEKGINVFVSIHSYHSTRGPLSKALGSARGSCEGVRFGLHLCSEMSLIS